MKMKSALTAMMFVTAVSAAMATEPKQIGWDSLVPDTGAALDNPFEALTPEHISALRKILKIENGQTPWDVDDPQAHLQALRAELAADGLDVDWLFEQRLKLMEHSRRAAEAINEDLVGTDVKLPGYVLPLEFDGMKAVEFLLVPSVGACIHTPPPPANQMVHVRYAEGIDVSGLYEPVWISGTLVAQSSVQTVTYSDGQSSISMSYMMQPDLVEKY